MKEFWEYFENMNEYVYVSDIDTYDIVYMNKRAKDLFGVDLSDSLEGRKCYEIMHNCSMPCQLCNNKSLKPDAFFEWSAFNPSCGRSFIIKDTMIEKEGRKYRVELGIEKNPENYDANYMEKHDSLERLANEAVRLSLRAATPDGSIDVILEYLGKVLKAERTYVFERNSNGCDDNTYEWVAKGVRPEKDNLQNLPAEVCANWYANFREGKKIVINDLEDIHETDPLKYDMLKRQDIHSLVVVPLYKDGEAIGFYGVDNPSKQYMDVTSNILQMMAYFIISALNRRSLMRKLQDLSYGDQLTGVGNRYAMWKFCQELQKGKSLGVLYSDVTGLKKVNDTLGHTYGDQLICTSCECIKMAFEGYDIFRIGGDEIVVFCSGIEENNLIERVKRLKDYTVEKKVVLAIGFAWSEECPDDIEAFMAKAEKFMYIDKRNYYLANGIERRRE